MENTTTFVSGLYLNKVSDSAPDFIITNQSIHMETLFKWLQANKGLADEKGYIRLVGKESKEGKRYFQVDTWKPKTEAVSEQKDITSDFSNGAVPASQLPPF